MKRKITAIVAGACAASILFTGCGSEISNDYVTISQYKNLEVTKVEATEVTDEDVESEIQYMLETYSTYNSVTDRAAQEGDTVTIDYVGTKDGVAFDGGTADDYHLELGSGTFIDGFEDGIIGHNIGDVFDLNLTFPESFGTAELAGQDVVFNVTLEGITEVVVPELTDEWVQSVSEESTTVDEYREELRQQMTEYYAESAQSELETAVWEAFIGNVTVNSYDTEELQDLIASYRTQYETYAENYGMEFEEFLAYYSKTEDDFNSEISTMAKEQLKETYATALVIEKEKLDVSDEKLREVYAEYVDYFGAEDVDQLIEAMEADGLGDSLAQLAKSTIVRDWLVENCKQVEATEESSAE